MPSGRTASGALFYVAVCGCLGTAGCGADIIDACFLDSPGSSYQLAPSGRAVAFSDPASYGHIVYRPDSPGPLFGCVLDEFTRLFKNQPDSLVIVLDFESLMVTLERALHEAGLGRLGDAESEELTSEQLLAFVEATSVIRRTPIPTVGSFTWTFRRFETGVGQGLLQPFPAGPPTLHGYVFLGRKEQLVAGTFLHEFCHHWAARLVAPRVFAEQTVPALGHWGYSSVGGVLGGWLPGSLVSTGEGVYEAKVAPAGRATGKSPYAPLELYLMGLAGPEEVPPIEVAVGVKRLGRSDDFKDIFSASAIETVTIEQIIEANGPRLPAVEDSPKHFKLALVVLTDHELSDAQWDFYERAMDFMAAPEERLLNEAFPAELYSAHLRAWTGLAGDELAENNTEDLPFLNFYAATGGRGTMEFVTLVPK